jgi:RNA polymerase sigma factor (sigma-70 family)
MTPDTPSAPNPTVDLVRRARAGDAAAFAGLVRRYQDMAVGYAWSLLGDFHLAEDAAQDAFVQVFGELDSLREPAAFGGWLRRIVFKYCDRRTRRSQLPTVALEGVVEQVTADVGATTALDDLERAETAAVVHRAIVALPKAQREAVALFYIGQHSQTQVAAFLDVPEGTVRKRLHDARQSLKERMLDMVGKTLKDDAPSQDGRFATHVLLGAACERGDLAEVTRILAEMPELARQDALSNDEHQPLHYAVYGNQVEVVRYLLEQGADPLKGIYPHREATTARALAFDRGFTPIVEAIDRSLEEKRGASDAGRQLCDAAGRGDVAVVTSTLDADASLVEAKDNHGLTPLLRAVRGGHLGLVKELLDRGADVDAEGASGRPLRFALDHGWKTPDEDYPTYTAIAGLLVGRGAAVDLWAAAGLGDVEEVRRRIAAGDEINPGGGGGNTPLTVAAFRGHVGVVRLLLESGADADAARQIEVGGEPFEERGEPLWLAANCGHLEVVKALLAGGATAAGTIYASGTPIEQALLHGHHEIADLLFLHGGEGHPLALCVTNNIPALAEHLRANPEAREGLLWSALCAGNETVVEHELAHGGAVPLQQQHTLFSQAIRGWRLGDLKICNAGWDRRSAIRNLQRLVDAGCDVNVRNPRSARADFTMLHHLAARACNPSIYGHTDEEVVEFARIFLDGGAEIDALESQLHSTPLGWSARYGQVALCRFLLSRGADVNGGDEPWAKPLAWAERYGHDEVAALLREAGAA